MKNKFWIFFVIFILTGCQSISQPEIRGLQNTPEIEINSPEKIQRITESMNNEQD